METGAIVSGMMWVLAGVVWYQTIRYKRQYPISGYLASIILVFAVTDIVMNQTPSSIFIAFILALILIMLVLEKKKREKYERLRNANAEENVHEPKVGSGDEDSQRRI